MSVQQNKITNIEILRCLAALGIVWFHTENAWGRCIGYTGLPVFILIFISLLAGHFHYSSFSVYIQKRFRRLIIPWLFWSVVYALSKIANAIRLNKDIGSLFRLEMCLVGTNTHLWYLPFAFICSIVLYFLCKISLKEGHRQLWAGTLLVGLGLLVLSSYILSHVNLSAPFAQWLFALPALPLGLAAGLSRRVENSKARIYSFGVICLFTIVLCTVLHFLRMPGLVVPYSVGVILVSAAYLIKSSGKAFWMTLGSLTYGIYLIHPLVANILYQIFNINSPWVQILSTYFISSVIIWGFKKTRMQFLV